MGWAQHYVMWLGKMTIASHITSWHLHKLVCCINSPACSSVVGSPIKAGLLGATQLVTLYSEYRLATQGRWHIWCHYIYATTCWFVAVKRDFCDQDLVISEVPYFFSHGCRAHYITCKIGSQLVSVLLGRVRHKQLSGRATPDFIIVIIVTARHTTTTTHSVVSMSSQRQKDKPLRT